MGAGSMILPLFSLINLISMTRFYVTMMATLLTGASMAQGTSVKETTTKTWYQQDKTASGHNGISLDKAYELIKTKNLKSKTVTVAVIDSGIDTLHEDLKP